MFLLNCQSLLMLTMFFMKLWMWMKLKVKGTLSYVYEKQSTAYNMLSKTRCANMSHSLKMAELWQHWCPQHNTVEGWIPPVNIYLPCECVSVCGAARRQELLWGFICGMTRQPVIYRHLELLFKHSLISRQTFPKARAEQQWPEPDQTRQDLTPSPCIPPNPWTECRAHKLGTVHQSECVYVYRVCSVSATAENNNVAFQWRQSSAQSFSSALLIGLEVNGTEGNINGHDPSSSTDLNIIVETSTKHPSLMMLFGGIYFTLILR